MTEPLTKKIYLDFNASTLIDPQVVSVMTDALEDAFGNPSSPHWAGTQARSVVEKSEAEGRRPPQLFL